MIDARRALEALIRDYADIGARSRMGLRITAGDAKSNYDVHVLGLIQKRRILVVTAPTMRDGSLIAVMKGQQLTCRWFSASTAFRFSAVISRVVFEPIPLIHIDLPPVIERQSRRGVPRGLCTLRALLKTPSDVEAVVVDMSVTGARIAVAEAVRLEKKQELVLIARPKMLQRSFEVILRCQVTSLDGALDKKHPHVDFYGLRFLEVDDSALLTLHSYVQECLTFEADVLSQLLLSDSKEVANLL